MSHEGPMDGIPVKISENYKPPPRINLPMSYAQRLQLNRQIAAIPHYEFALEKTVVEKMREWRTIRKQVKDEQEERLTKSRVDREKIQQKPESSNHVEKLLVPTPILTPVQLDINQSRVVQVNSPFNIAEFEADTSSPFDNMALKSMNDLEELAQVLKSDSQTKPTYTYSNYDMHIPTTSYGVQPVISNGYTYPNTIANNSYAGYSPPKEERHSAIPNIIKTLQTELNNTHIDNNKMTVVPKSRDVEQIEEELTGLPKQLQDLCRTISSMGFPLSRVVRVCKLLGNDHKKVVEHLLAMSELLDLGFPETSVSSALLQCGNDRDKALDILIS